MAHARQSESGMAVVKASLAGVHLADAKDKKVRLLLTLACRSWCFAETLVEVQKGGNDSKAVQGYLAHTKSSPRRTLQ